MTIASIHIFPWRSTLAFAVLLSVCSPILAAGPTPDTATPWRTLTRIDVDAAYRLLKDNHPAATAEAGDAKFVSALEAAHAKALQRAAAVTNIDGYSATLGEFANSMGDGHIWSNMQVLPRNVQWAGIIAAKRGANWVVAGDEPKIVGVELAGARIVSCDGVAVDELAREILHFHTVVAVEAMQIVHAGSLLVDDGNPFVTRPRACTFEIGSKDEVHALNWTKIGYTKLHETYWKHPYGQAGFGMRALDAGYWISIQSLEPEAQPVIDSAKAQADKLRNAQFVVVDLRGNGGGGDSYGRALAEVLYGPAYVTSILGPMEDTAGGCASVFRASPGNIDALAKMIEQFQREGFVDGAKEYGDAVVAMKAAAARHEALTGPPTCPANPATAVAGDAPKSLMKAPVVVLTDALCFSSCINTVDFFRKLGAIQAGDITGSDTHYSEVREIVLPSGLSTFSTLDAIMPDAPPQIGPFAPDFTFTGDIADTDAVQQWIQQTVLRPGK